MKERKFHEHTGATIGKIHAAIFIGGWIIAFCYFGMRLEEFFILDPKFVARWLLLGGSVSAIGAITMIIPTVEAGFNKWSTAFDPLWDISFGLIHIGSWIVLVFTSYVSLMGYPEYKAARLIVPLGVLFITSGPLLCYRKEFDKQHRIELSYSIKTAYKILGFSSIVPLTISMVGILWYFEEGFNVWWPYFVMFVIALPVCVLGLIKGADESY